MLTAESVSTNDDLDLIQRCYMQSEAKLIPQLLEGVAYLQRYDQPILALAKELTQFSLEAEHAKTGVAGLVRYYDLSTEEGIVLMCIAEALLRIPDAETEKLLLADKLSSANWASHLGRSQSSFINASTWGLALTGKILSPSIENNRFANIWHKMIKKSGEGVIRKAVRYAIKLMSKEFVLGRTIEEAVKRGRDLSKKGYTFSFDMLGEAAMTLADADKYFDAYSDAIEKISQHIDPQQSIFQRPGISVKLSALYPRYEFTQQRRAIPVLVKLLRKLCYQARDAGLALTVDAEEAERLTMSLAIFKEVYVDSALAGWSGLGLAVQAYQRRAPAVIDWVIALAKEYDKPIQVRLVKGAYWDTEIKHAQMNGWQDYPVFTRKAATDVTYLACAKVLLEAQQVVYPKFATHNAYSVAAILTLIDQEKLGTDIEFQNLQGMCNVMYPQLRERGIPCRIYAPVGSHEDLLPYLVRRLLENGANSSFINQLSKANISVDELLENPLSKLQSCPAYRNHTIPLPSEIFVNRQNSSGVNVSNGSELGQLIKEAEPFWQTEYQIAGDGSGEEQYTVHSPAELSDVVGQVAFATKGQATIAMDKAAEAFDGWNARLVDDRAVILETMANLLEQHRAELTVLMMREAGKVLSDCVDEIREAVDFCRYYAVQARSTLKPQQLIGYTGEDDSLVLTGRGVVVCISPWNFPIAIFVGQIAAALVVGNTVVAKPAEQTSIIASKVIDLFFEAGVPRQVLSMLAGRGEVLGETLMLHAALAGVIFTGSTVTAKTIQRTLAQSDGPIVPLIAETGGLNAMIADSSCLPEQLVADVLHSAFGSAGQRCSALRLLFVQEDVADKIIEMLVGAMKILEVNEPKWLQTDIGPVIDVDALKMLQAHEQYLTKHARLLHKCELPQQLHGHYFAPQAYLLDDTSCLQQEVFGPILHVIRYRSAELNKVIADINAFHYGLTFGIHSRINTTVDYIKARVKAGNIYVNRNMIGAVVGLQPFGGRGLSGTGPKAGGPHYLARLCTEVTTSIDTTAAGGNASLMIMAES